MEEKGDLTHMEEYRITRPVYMDYLLMFVGTALMAVAINSIYDPISMVTGGFTGIAIIVKALTEKLFGTGVPLWLTNLVLNIPFFLLGLKIKGASFLKRTLFATVALSFWLYVIPVMPLMMEDMVLSSLFGGGIMGVGIGMVLLGHATTGGTDLVASIIQSWLKHYSIVQIMQVLDGMIVIFGVFVFGITPALYALLAIAVTTFVSDRLIEGTKFARVAFIITEKKEEVASAILHDLGRGATQWDAEGLYSGRHKNLLFCVVGKKEIVLLKEAVASMDKDAFVVVSDAREVLGEGFLERKA